MIKHELKFVTAKWSVPTHVRAVTTMRMGGYSNGPYAEMNPASHVGDDAGAVARNQQLLMTSLGLADPVQWLKQVHGNKVIAAEQLTSGVSVEADGSVTDRANVVCAILTADCLPLFLCDRAGERVGLLHVGWRGLAAGVVANGVRALATPPEDIVAWLGPAIGPSAFEVGEDVYRALANDAASAEAFNALPAAGKWCADLYRLVAHRLRLLGVYDVTYDASLCTYSHSEDFFSYRRDGRCGRMASLVWKTH